MARISAARDVRKPLAPPGRTCDAGRVPAVITHDHPLFARFYGALRAHDARFDGQFVAGVLSTGIYCRPSCPAVTASERNVVFYRTSAAAHEAGLRACKRCLPDAVPGSPDWNVRDDLAARAMRLIEDGVVEREGVPGLAARLGYTPRHLSRVLVAELGAGPLALARAHRAQTARALLASTGLPIVDVAFAAGFASVRQFNDTIRAVYDRTPSQLRARARPEAPSAHGGSAPALTLRLPARTPFDAAGVFRFLADHAVPGLEEGDEGRFARRVRLPAGVARVEILPDMRPGVIVRARVEAIADVAPLVARVRRLFDLDADSAAIDDALGADPALAPLVRAVPGIRIPGSLDAEEALFRTLIGQQISRGAARTVLARLTAELGDDGLFPTAARIAADGAAVLRGPAARIGSVLAIARALADGAVSLGLGAPVEERRAALLTLPGVGPWTADYLAMRAFGAPDVLLASDLVVRRSAAGLGLPSSPSALARRTAAWAPWRSYATLHLWRAATADAG